jgi:hypothetical protein
MKKIVFPPQPPFDIHPLRLGLLAIILTAVWIGISNWKVYADGGGFPTRTPTITPTKTPTIPLTITPTASPTILPTLTLVVLLEQQGQAQPLVASVTQTPAPERSSGLRFSCWPIALLVVLVLIIGVTYYFTRRTQPEE